MSVNLFKKVLSDAYRQCLGQFKNTWRIQTIRYRLCPAIFVGVEIVKI
jgi:hypothetical protein